MARSLPRMISKSPPRWDFEIILGNDLAIGYERHDTETVTLYFTSSFTFRILDAAGVIHFTAQ